MFLKGNMSYDNTQETKHHNLLDIILEFNRKYLLTNPVSQSQRSGKTCQMHQNTNCATNRGKRNMSAIRSQGTRLKFFPFT